MGNPYKFMMVEDLSQKTKLGPRLFQLGILKKNEASGEGEIIYFRDSDDEMPDSDEDPDDDLDI